MNIKKEVWIVVGALGFLLSWIIDRLAGPVSIVVGNPIAFLTSPILLNTYPFTATAIIIRTIDIFISVMLIISVLNGKYFLKAILLFFVGLLSEFYAIQQLATGFRLTTIQWTLSIAYSALSLVLGIIIMILMGIWASFNKKETSRNIEKDNKEESILNPPTE